MSSRPSRSRAARSSEAQKSGFPAPRTSIRHRIIRASILVAALSIAVLSLLSILVVRTLLTDRVLAQVSSVASARKDILESTVQHDRERVALMRDRSEVRQAFQAGSRAPLAAMFDEQRSQSLPLLGITLFDASHRAVASVGVESDPPPPAEATAFVPAIDSVGAWRGYDVYTPIRATATTQTGTLAVHYDAVPLLAHVFGNVDAGESADIVLGRSVNGSIGVLHHYLEKDNLHSFSLGAADAQSTEGVLLARAINGGEGAQKIVNSAGETILAAYRFLPTVGWGMVVAVDRESALGGVRTFALQLLIISVLLMGCAAIIGYFLATSLTAPLTRLAARLHLLKPGHWSFRRTVHTGDEVEALDRVIADLSSRLKKTYDHLEELVAERTQELQKAYALDRAILDGIESGVITVDTQGVITDANPAAYALLGYKKEEMIGKPAVEVLRVSQRRLEGTADQHPVTLALSARQSFRSNSFQHMSLLKQDQTLLPVTLTVTPLMQEQTSLGAIVLFQDMTEERQIDYMKSEFITLASHQLRTPLSAVRWNLELMGEENGALSESQKAFLQEISNSSTRMANVLDELLRAAKLEESERTVTLQQIDLVAFLQRIAHDNEPMALKSTIRLTLALPEQPVSITTDPLLLEVTVQNILANAMKYSNAGSEVHLSMTASPTAATIAVEDHGMGIPAGEQSRVFHRFFRAHNIRQKDTDGSGLGLYIAKHSIETLGGTISFVSTEGKGSVFTISIPLQEKEQSVSK